jgi:hypothetical protein
VVHDRDGSFCDPFDPFADDAFSFGGGRGEREGWSTPCSKEGSEVGQQRNIVDHKRVVF